MASGPIGFKGFKHAYTKAIDTKKNFSFHIHLNNNRCRFKDLYIVVFELQMLTRFCFMNPMDNFKFEIIEPFLKKGLNLKFASGQILGAI